MALLLGRFWFLWNSKKKSDKTKVGNSKTINSIISIYIYHTVKIMFALKRSEIQKNFHTFSNGKVCCGSQD